MNLLLLTLSDWLYIGDMVGLFSFYFQQVVAQIQNLLKKVYVAFVLQQFFDLWNLFKSLDYFSLQELQHYYLDIQWSTDSVETPI